MAAAHGAESRLAGAALSESAIESVALAATEGALPLRHNAWKIPLVRALVKRALDALADAGLRSAPA